MAGSRIKKLFFVNKTWRINICRDIQQSGGEHAVVQERIIKSVHSLSSFSAYNIRTFYAGSQRLSA